MSNATVQQVLCVFVFLYAFVSFIFSCSLKLPTFSLKCFFFHPCVFLVKFKVTLTIPGLPNHTGLQIVPWTISAEMLSPASQDNFMMPISFIWIPERSESHLLYQCSKGFVLCLLYLLYFIDVFKFCVVMAQFLLHSVSSFVTDFSLLLLELCQWEASCETQAKLIRIILHCHPSALRVCMQCALLFPLPFLWWLM